MFLVLSNLISEYQDKGLEADQKSALESSYPMRL